MTHMWYYSLGNGHECRFGKGEVEGQLLWMGQMYKVIDLCPKYLRLEFSPPPPPLQCIRGLHVYSHFLGKVSIFLGSLGKVSWENQERGCLICNCQWWPMPEIGDISFPEMGGGGVQVMGNEHIGNPWFYGVVAGGLGKGGRSDSCYKSELLTRVVRLGLESLFFLLATWLATCRNDLRLDLDLQQNTCDLLQITCYLFKSRNCINISRNLRAPWSASSSFRAFNSMHGYTNMIALADSTRLCVPDVVQRARTQLFT